MMSWGETDLSAEIEKEEDSIYQAFGSSGYDIELYRIPTNQSQVRVQMCVREFVRKAVPDSLLILVYTGHGGYDHSMELLFSGYGSDGFVFSSVFDNSKDKLILRSHVGRTTLIR